MASAVCTSNGSGFKYIFVQEARELFGQDLDDERLRMGHTVKTIDYSAIGSEKAKRAGLAEIVVETDKGRFAAPHVVSTFSVGVLQHQDVQWVPRLPDWKKEAIFTFAMATYQKVGRSANAPAYIRSSSCSRSSFGEMRR